MCNEILHKGGIIMNKIRVVQWGLGNMGRGMVDMLFAKEGIEVVGAIEKRVEDTVDLGSFLGKEELGIPVMNDPDALLEMVKPDLCILAIHSFV